jgi:hypothetical protein
VNSYDEDNYLLSLERRAYNLASNEHGELERHSQELKRDSFIMSPKRRISTGSYTTNYTTLSEDTELDPTSPIDEAGYEGDEYEEEEDSSSVTSDPDTSTTTTKKRWFSDMTHSVETITRKSLDLRPNFVKRNVKSDESSEDDQQKTGFFSRWTPGWSKKNNIS